MAKLLVFDRDNTHSDPEKEYRGCYKKGYVVETFEDTKPYVNPPQPPFLILQITDKTKAEVDEYMRGWVRQVDYSVIQRSVPLDGWRLELKATNPNASGKGHITLAKVQTYLENWGASIVGVVNNGVQFDITVFGIVQSENFWGKNPSLIVFNEAAYDEATGVHTVEANYGALPVPPKATLQQFEADIAQRVTEVGGTVISNTGGVIVFDIHRDVVVDRVKSEIKRLSEDTVCRRQKYLDPAFVDQIIAGGRVMIATAAEVAPYIKDRITE